MDAKADRKAKTLIIHNLHFEKVKISEAVKTKFVDAIKAFAAFNGCTKITLSQCNNRIFLKDIRQDSFGD